MYKKSFFVSSNYIRRLTFFLATLPPLILKPASVSATVFIWTSAFFLLIL